MGKQTITFRTDARSKMALDAIAAGLDRDRSYVLNEAISNYLEIHQWQVAHIKEGLRQADAGEFAKDSEVSAAFARWRK
jgi:predicted transcriptional regulator